MSRILVTGGAGFIGSRVAHALLARGHAVTVLDDLSGRFADSVPSGAAFVQGSITDAALVDDLFASSSFEYVYHLAACAAEGLSHFIKRFNYTNNVIGIRERGPQPGTPFRAIEVTRNLPASWRPA